MATNGKTSSIEVMFDSKTGKYWQRYDNARLDHVNRVVYLYNDDKTDFGLIPYESFLMIRYIR